MLLVHTVLLDAVVQSGCSSSLPLVKGVC